MSLRVQTADLSKIATSTTCSALLNYHLVWSVLTSAGLINTDSQGLSEGGGFPFPATFQKTSHCNKNNNKKQQQYFSIIILFLDLKMSIHCMYANTNSLNHVWQVLPHTFKISTPSSEKSWHETLFLVEHS